LALLAEEIVEEWLRRQGFFTIRGIKIGVQEIDLLAIRPTANGLECRHVEVQASTNPIGYLSRLSKEDQLESGLKATSKKSRSEDQLRRGLTEWIDRKFDLKEKAALRERLVSTGARSGSWSRELVVHRVAFPIELDLLAERGVTVIRLGKVISDLRSGPKTIEKAGGADFLDLLLDDFDILS
jgi:hypothetical protein